MDDMPNVLDVVSSLIASARNATDLGTKIMYASLARSKHSSLAESLSVRDRSLLSVEAELVRLSKGASNAA